MVPVWACRSSRSRSGRTGTITIAAGRGIRIATTGTTGRRPFIARRRRGRRPSIARRPRVRIRRREEDVHRRRRREAVDLLVLLLDDPSESMRALARSTMVGTLTALYPYQKFDYQAPADKLKLWWEKNRGR